MIVSKRLIFYVRNVKKKLLNCFSEKNKQVFELVIFIWWEMLDQKPEQRNILEGFALYIQFCWYKWLNEEILRSKSFTVKK